MKTSIELYVRLTSTYRTGWQGLDHWEHIGPVKHTRLVDVSSPDEDDYETHRCLVTIPKDTLRTARRIHRHAKPTANFSRWLGNQVAALFDYGCQCEHDCCGHMQRYGVANKVDGKWEFTVKARGCRNV